MPGLQRVKTVSQSQGPPTPYAVFLYGVNIPGGRWLSQTDLQTAAAGLRPSLVFREIVGDTDNILFETQGPQTDRTVQTAVEGVLDSRCVAIDINSLQIIVGQAIDMLRSLGVPLARPYRVTLSGEDWEFGLVMCSERLPSGVDEKLLLFEPRKNVVPLGIMGGQALLVRKRSRTAGGSRIMFGRALIDPWERILRANGITPACLTSRSLSRVEEVVNRASRL